MAYTYKRLMNFFKNESNRGTYLSGRPQEDIIIKKGDRLYLFPNEYKKEEKQPDFNLCVREGNSE
jgi:hypothetical protein